MGGRRRGARRSTRAAAAAMLVTAIGAGAIFLSVRHAGVAMGRLLPPRTEIDMRLALVKAQLPNQKLGPAELAAARRAAIAEPLAYEPFFIAARAAEQSGRLSEAITLMEEARRRRPSYAAARVALMGYYAMAGRYVDSVAEADVAMRLSGEAQRAILPILAGMLPYREARPGIARILAGEPSWRGAFLDVARAKADPDDAAGLLAELRRLKPAAATAPEASLLVSALVRTGRYPQARRVWLTLVPPADRGRGGLVFDGDFRGVPAPPPFNWTFAASAAGRAEPGRRSAGEPPRLEASYFGGSPAVLAEQTLVLSPGRYRLSIQAKADREQVSADLSWQLTCLPARGGLARLPLSRFSQGYGGHALEFAVPAGCTAQSLSLLAEPGDLSQPINMQFRQLSVERL